MTPESLKDSPQPVRDYFDGQESCDLLAVQNWAVEKGEVNLLKQLASDGFQGSICVFSIYSQDVMELAIKSELPIEFQPGQINSTNAIELIGFLRSPPVKIERLHLDISSDIDSDCSTNCFKLWVLFPI